MEKRVALVTGAAGGIGRAISLAFAKSGMDVVISYNGSREKAEKTAELCREYGSETLVLQGDISSEKICQKLVDETISTFGRIDVLVNNAGVTRDGLFVRMKEEAFDAVIDTNLKGSFFMSKYASIYMLKQRYGRIVNITSVVGLHGNAGQANYSASKAGLIGLTKSCAKELGKKGILVNAVAPGFVETDMTNQLSDKVKSAILEQTVLGTLAQPEDVARVVEFLATEENRYITGQVITVDGGMSI